MSNSLKEFQELLAVEFFGKTEAEHCVQCKQPFSDSNTHTEAGWKETKISRMCEDCFDKIFEV